MSDSNTNKSKELHGRRIEDYALIGDLETAALVSREGSIDWLCWPSFSSGACFAALLGTRDHGFWKIAPASGEVHVRRNYQGHTLILETTFETPEGKVLLTDFMPPRGQHSHIIRSVKGLEGQVPMRFEMAVRFDYGRTVPWVTHTGQNMHATAGPDMVVLQSPVSLRGEGLTTVGEFAAAAGQTITFHLTNTSSIKDAPPEVNTDSVLKKTQEFWNGWSGRNTYKGKYTALVERSLLTLKAMTYKPSGGIVAAATSSLPEQIGGSRNWDYRYCWLRDTAFTLLVLMIAGYQEEAIAWRLWLLRAIAGAPEQIQTVYGICGERQLIEWTPDWLPGYEGSSPVRIGNGAVDQFQLDVFGEVAAALLRTPEANDDIRLDATAVQAALIDHLCKVWQEPDEGIWEVRGPRKHFTHSKVMAWVALDRAIKHYEQHDGGGDVERWRHNRDLIHREVCDRGFSKKLNSFVQSYDSEELDASCLRIILVGFLPPDDPRIRGTVEAIERRLLRNGLVARYDTNTGDDGLPGSEGAFLACSFWLVINRFLIGRQDDATELFEKLLGLCNDVGLLSEEYDPVAKRMLGNFPQALSHIALVHAAFTLSGMWKPEPFARP